VNDINNNGDGFTREQIIAINALSAGLNKDEAAAQAGVSKRTVYRWLEDPLFSSEIIIEVTDRLEPITNLIIEGAMEGVNVILATVRDAGVDRHTRLKAAMYLVDAAYRLVLIEPLKRRLEEVEAEQAATSN
jgi:hypothetical protein